MKRFLLIFILIAVYIAAFSQSQQYNELKNYYRNFGYSIGSEKVVTLMQNQSGFSYFDFYAGYEYILVAMSEDSDVIDVDLFAYYFTGDLFMKDVDSSNLAIIRFNCITSSRLKVLVYNYHSRTPKYSSIFRYFVVYK